MTRLADALFALCRIGSGLALVAMVAMVFGEIVSRNLFGVSLHMSEEVAGYLLVALAFLGFSVSFRSGDLMRIEAVYDNLSPTGRQAADIVFDAVALAAVLICAWYSGRFVWSSYWRGTVAPTLLQTPLWVPQSVIPVGLAILALALALRVAGNAAALRRAG